MHGLSPPVTHRDIKSQNLLLTNAGGGAKRIQLCDFGLAFKKPNEPGGTPHYAAPGEG